MGTWPNFSSVMFLLLGILLMLVPGFVRGQSCAPGVQPTLTCISQVETIGTFPNLFFGLNQFAQPPHFTPIPDQTLYSYDPSVGLPPGGTLFPPGLTEVTFTAEDSCGNSASCTFNVFNPLTELPVACPEFGGTVPTDADSATHTFTTPSFGADDVQLDPSINLYPYHGEVNVAINVEGAPNLEVGTHTIETVISDNVLSRTCTSTLIVQDEQQPTITCTDLTTTDANDNLLSAVDASDNADTSPEITFSENPPFTLGTFTVTATATDDSGNNASCSFNLIVQASPTTAAPTKPGPPPVPTKPLPKPPVPTALPKPPVPTPPPKPPAPSSGSNEQAGKSQTANSGSASDSESTSGSNSRKRRRRKL